MEETTTESKNVLYEIGFLLKLSTTAEPITKALSASGAELVKEAPLKSISLAYPIKKQEKAEFGYIHFRLSRPEALQEISEALRFEKDVLRSLVVSLPEKKMKEALRPKRAHSARAKAETPEAPKEEGIQNLDSLSNEALEEKLEELVQ